MGRFGRESSLKFSFYFLKIDSFRNIFLKFSIFSYNFLVAEKAEDLQPVEQAIDLIDQAMDAAADMPEDNLVGFLDNNKDQIDSKKPKLDEETIKRNKETLKRVVKNQNLLDILVERNVRIPSKTPK